MKKEMVFIIAILILCNFAFTACAGDDIDAPMMSPVTSETPIVDDDDIYVENSPAPEQDGFYTIEQIQAALEGKIIGTIIAVEKVEMDRDSITYTEPAHETYDLSGATRYKVTHEVIILSDELYMISIDATTGEELRIRQWEGEEYREEGDYVIFTFIEYYYFNDDNGTPVSIAWHC